MRLLHCDAADRLILTDFRCKPIPPYAILSHRWSDSEALIEDIPNANYKEKEEGYQKLKFCAEQAAKDGLQYFWVDTCCIDRWDNNERSKAINSMFEWYRKAARCYVFLPDVSAASATEASQRSSWEASFRRSDWFKRGWTLQELIAPVSVEFFSCEGRRIGDRTSLDQLIYDRTGIPLAALHNCSLDQFSASERSQWATDRNTTEEEDIVYCLLGLLGISMPITYGEGRESAQRRLQAELDATGNAPSMIPFLRNESFVGREAQLAELEARLFSNDQTTTTLAIVGAGGTGKSQLALEVAHRTGLTNKDCSVFWMDASDMDSLSRSYASVARKLSIPGCDDDQADIKRVVKRCVAEVSTRRCLLIFDNIECTALLSCGSSTIQAADLADFLPHSKLCSVIFTTTDRDTAEVLAPRNVTALRKLTPDTALRMLQNHLTTPLSNIEQQHAMRLSEELSYLPLAVVQAAACMNASHMTVQQYRTQLAEHKEAALGHSGDALESEQQEACLREMVAAILDLSIRQIRQSNAIAADYLSVAACVDRKDISLDLLEATSLQVRDDAVRILDKYNLVSRRPAESAFDVHRLVHQALRKRLQVQGQLRQWTRRTMSQLLRVFPDDDHSNRSKWRRLLPHAQHALSQSVADDDDKEGFNLAWKCAMALYCDGRYGEAEELQERVMQSWKRLLGDEHPDTLTSMANLASTLNHQGRWKESEELNMQVMQPMKRVFGDEHPDTLTSTANLASTYWNQGRWKEAEDLEVQVMQIRKRVLGDEHPDALLGISNLASTYRSQGRWKEAEGLQVQVMQTRKRLLGDEHPDTLTSMANLALTYCRQGRWNRAEELNMQVTQMTTRLLGDEHPDTLTSTANLALTYWKQGRWKEAEDLEVQVMQIRKRVLGDEHPDALLGISNLASTYRSQGLWKKAEELEVQVMQTRKRLLGDEHPDTLTSMANLALTYRNQDRWKEAEGLQVGVMQKTIRLLGVEHPSTLTSIANLASTLSHQNRLKEAEMLEVHVMHMRQRLLGDEHPDTLTSTANLALTYWKQGRWKEAEDLEVQVVQIRRRVLGDEHPDTLLSIHNFAFTLYSQGRREEALALMESCFQLRQQVLGEQHPNTQLSLGKLKDWRVERGDENSQL